MHEHRSSMEQAVLQQRGEVKRLEDQLRSTELVVAQLSRRLNNNTGRDMADEMANNNNKQQSDPLKSNRPAYSGFSSPDILKRVYKNNTGNVHTESGKNLEGTGIYIFISLLNKY